MTLKGYPKYDFFKLDRPAERVLRVTMTRGKVNAMNYQMHHDLATIWPLVDADPKTSCVLLAADGPVFSAGGDFDNEEKMIGNYDYRIRMWKDTRDLIQNMINMSKPVVTAVNGAAVGAGLAAAMVSDITIAARSAKFVDGHTRLGVPAGDHAVLTWPLMCGMAKAKLYLLTCDHLPAEEAERIGLISLCVDDDKLEEKSLDIAGRLARIAPSAVRWTKHSLNNWYRMAWPLFEASLALEMIGFGGPEPKEGLAAHLEKREPKFDPNCPF
jgi:enoyl-CoA hydratase